MNDKLYEQLMAYFDGELEPNERARLEDVIKASEACQAQLREWEANRRFFQKLPLTDSTADLFVNRVMNGLRENEVPSVVESAALPDFIRWLLPSLGYALSAMLVFFTFSVKHPSVVNADSILLTEMPVETHSIFLKHTSDVSQMFATEEM